MDQPTSLRCATLRGETPKVIARRLQSFQRALRAREGFVTETRWAPLQYVNLHELAVTYRLPRNRTPPTT